MQGGGAEGEGDGHGASDDEGEGEGAAEAEGAGGEAVGHASTPVPAAPRAADAVSPYPAIKPATMAAPVTTRQICLAGRPRSALFSGEDTTSPSPPSCNQEEAH